MCLKRKTRTYVAIPIQVFPEGNDLDDKLHDHECMDLNAKMQWKWLSMLVVLFPLVNKKICLEHWQRNCVPSS